MRQPRSDAPSFRQRVEALPHVELAGFERSTHPWRGHQTTWDLCAVTEGASEWRYRGRTMLSTPGTLRFKEPGESFRTLSVKSPSSIRILRLAPAYLGAVVGAASTSALHFRPLQLEGEPERFRLLCTLIDQLAQARTKLARETILLDGLSALLVGHLEGERREPPPPAHRSVRRVREYIDAHFGRELSLDELAQVAEVHPVYLSRLFSRQVGLPPHAYQTERRVIAAKHHLRAGMQSAQVALAVGFFDQSHFIRQFKRITGVTPHAFRAMP